MTQWRHGFVVGAGCHGCSVTPHNTTHPQKQGDNNCHHCHALDPPPSLLCLKGVLFHQMSNFLSAPHFFHVKSVSLFLLFLPTWCCCSSFHVPHRIVLKVQEPPVCWWTSIVFFFLPCLCLTLQDLAIVLEHAFGVQETTHVTCHGQHPSQNAMTKLMVGSSNILLCLGEE